MNKIISALTALTLLVLMGCVTPLDNVDVKKDDNKEVVIDPVTPSEPVVTPDPETPKPVVKKVQGKFAVVPLSKNESLARGIDIGTYNINSSSAIFFIIKNLGDTPLTEVRIQACSYLSTTNLTGNEVNNFTITPDTSGVHTLTLLPSGQSSIDTLVKVEINHGDMAGYMNKKNYLDPGFLGTTLHITGKTEAIDADGNNVLDATGAKTYADVILDADIGTVVHLARVAIEYDTTNGQDAWYPTYTDPFNPGFFSPIALIQPGTETGRFRLVNNGNVKIRVYDRMNAGVYWDVLPGEFVRLNLNNRPGNMIGLNIDTLGVQFDTLTCPGFPLTAGTSTMTIYVYKTYQGTR